MSYTDANVRNKIENWVRYLDLYNIHHWKTHVRNLNSYDTSGCFMIQDPPHYSGNFWWTKSSHLRKLPLLDKNNTPHLNRGEFWLCSPENTKMFNLPGCIEIDFYKNDFLNIHDFPSQDWI